MAGMYPYGTDEDRAREYAKAMAAFNAASEPAPRSPYGDAQYITTRPDTGFNRLEDFLMSTFGGGKGAMQATNAVTGGIDLLAGDVPYALYDGRYGDAASSLATDAALNYIGAGAAMKGGKMLKKLARGY